jgi:hypothetical protein
VGRGTLKLSASNFQGLSVLTLESRRGQEMTRLIEAYGGKPVHAPAMREVPVASNPGALKFADGLFKGELDVVVFLTGVGARALCKVLENAHPTEKFFEALRKVSIIARGPKPLAVLREWKVPVAITAPEPNTWREVFQAIDACRLDLRGAGYTRARLSMGFAGGSGTAAGSGTIDHRAPDRRGSLYDRSPTHSSFSSCRTSRKEGCTLCGLPGRGEGFHWPRDIRGSAKLRTIR